MPYIPVESVESSNIEAIGYHRQTSTLRVIFRGGRAYDYPMCPETEYKRMMAAESKGKFLNTRIKPMYAYCTPRPEELEPPKEPCCNHPDKPCDNDCGVCGPGCCPKELARTGQSLAHGLKRGKELIEETRATAASGAPPALPKTAEGEVDHSAIPDATPVLEKALEETTTQAVCEHPNKESNTDGSVVGCADCGADLTPYEPEIEGGTPAEENPAVIDTVCRCCGRAIRVPEEDAVDLCGLCFGGKGGDTDDQCTAEHTFVPGRLSLKDCPHGTDGRDCEEGCPCTCHESKAED